MKSVYKISFADEKKEKLTRMRAKAIKRFEDNKSSFKKLNTAGKVLSVTSVSASSAGVATAITVVGIPISAVLAGVSAVCGVSAFVVGRFSRKNAKKAIEARKSQTIIDSALSDISSIIAVGLNDVRDDISESDLKNIINIYNTTLKKVESEVIEGIESDLEELKKNDLNPLLEDK